MYRDKQVSAAGKKITIGFFRITLIGMDDDWKITIYLPNWHLFIKTKNRSMWIYDYFDLIQLRFWNAVISSSFEWNSFQKLLYHYLEINVVWQKFDRFSTKTKIHNVRTIHHLCVKLSKGLVVEYILYKCCRTHNVFWNPKNEKLL